MRLRVEIPKIGIVQIDPDVSLLVRLRVEISIEHMYLIRVIVSLLVRLRVEIPWRYKMYKQDRSASS